MSWSRRAASRVCAASMGAVALGGCFQPLYQGGAAGSAGAALSSIVVTPISERLGYYLTNELTFRFNGGAPVDNPQYRLTVALHERVQTPVVDTVSGQATAAIVGIDAEYKLETAGGLSVVTSGTAFTTETYDRTSQRFANIRAARDAEIRGAKVLGDQIFTRVAAALHSGG